MLAHISQDLAYLSSAHTLPGVADHLDRIIYFSRIAHGQPNVSAAKEAANMYSTTLRAHVRCCLASQSVWECGFSRRGCEVCARLRSLRVPLLVGFFVLLGVLGAGRAWGGGYFARFPLPRVGFEFRAVCSRRLSPLLLWPCLSLVLFSRAQPLNTRPYFTLAMDA